MNASGLGLLQRPTPPKAGATQNTTGQAAETSTVTINGITTGVVTSVANKAADRSAMVDAINAISGQTGVSATNTGAVIDLTAADGRNITHSFTSGAGAVTDFGLAAAATTGATMEITEDATEGGNTLIDGVADDTGDTGPFNATANATTGSALSTLDVTTRANASLMITGVDAALDLVNSNRATLGAIQNRFESIVNSVLIASRISQQLEADRRCRLCDGDSDSYSGSDPAAGWRGGSCAGQCAATECARFAAVICDRHRPWRRH